MDIKVNHRLDAKGLVCPMPIVKTKNKMAQLQPGEVLVVAATDRGSTADIEAWANSNGEYYLGTEEKDNVLHHYVRKASEEEMSEHMAYDKVVSLDELKTKLADEATVVVDVREPAEYAFHHIDGAVSIPLGEIEERSQELNKEDHIFVVCRTGNRSDFAAKMLADQGFKHVFNVVPGMTEWEE